MGSKTSRTTRIQAYITDRKVAAALAREARMTNLPMSQAAVRAMTRGLRHNLAADPDDRLLALERALRDHMRAMARDMQIVQELLVELARAFFLRLPDMPVDEDPTVLAAVERRIERLLDATAARIVAGQTASRRQAAREAEAGGEEEAGRPALAAGEPRAFGTGEP